MTADKVYLVGFMACGKSTVARALAGRLGWQIQDIDDLIEARERRSIADIFAKEGEPYFRSVEREMLRLVLPLRHAVVATGGGTFADADNRAAMMRDGVAVWLDVPLAELVTRLPTDGRRPLAADRAQLERLYAARVDGYRAAPIHIDASGRPTAEVVEQILEALDRPSLLLVNPSPATDRSSR